MKPSPRLPFVFVNMAMTADGKIATANRRVSSFGSARDLRHLYELRATADAVMAGARTIDLNDVKMGPGGRRFEALRVRNGLARFNLRVIVSGSGSIDPDAPIFRHRFSPILILTTKPAAARRRQALARIADEVIAAGDVEVDLRAALRVLRAKWGVKRLLCEGGGQLNDAMFRAGLVNELHLTICPKIFGGSAAPSIADGLGFASLDAAAPLELKSLDRVGDELFAVYSVPRRRN